MSILSKKKMLLLGLIIITAITFSMTTVKAEAATTLIKIEDKSITSEMKIEDVKKLFGEPKLVTDSYLGGKAYTFYEDDFDDYLYIETDKTGAIACYGSVDESFVTADYSFGDQVTSRVYRGYEATDYDDNIFGIMRYTKSYDAWPTFTENAAMNNTNMAQHTVHMWNAISHKYGGSTIEYNEDIYEIAAQLAENYSNMYDYCDVSGNYPYFDLISSGVIFFEGYRYPNPLMTAENARYHNVRKGFYPAFTFGETDDGDYNETVGFASPELFSQWKTVELTDEENELLTTAKAHYVKSVELVNNAETYYDVEPDYNSAANIVGGVINVDTGKGAVEYLNSIRTAAGLPALEYSEEIAECAQAKATYTMYLSANELNNPSPHFPPQVEGISDDFYEMCQSYMSENLYYTGLINTHVLYSIMNALCDSYDEPSCGHRYNLLWPSHKYMGVGSADKQGCHKLSGRQEYDVDVVAWPSKGIMPPESGFDATHMMTCQFYNGMEPTDNTVVTITCLNSDDVWTIDPDNLEAKVQYIHTSGSEISFRDTSFIIRSGGVYTFHYSNLIDSSGKTVDYEYRTVYLPLYDGSENNEGELSAITLDKSGLILQKGTSDKVRASIEPKTAKNKRIFWSSSNTDVATVNQYGVVNAVAEGTAEIMAITENGGLMASCPVEVHMFGDWTTDKKATCSTEGSKYRICGCGYRETEAIPKEKHDIIKHKGKEATCTKTGWQAYETCSRCDYTTYKTIGKTEHDTYEVTLLATTSHAGYVKEICCVCEKQISKKNIARIGKVSIPYTAYVYNGKERKPVVTVKDTKGNKLVKGTDYSVTYRNSDNKIAVPKTVGKYKVVVKFKDNYTGTVTRTFKIKPKGTAISKLTKPAKKQIKVTWKKQTVQTTGYQIRCSTKQNMSRAKIVTVTKSKTTAETIKQLKAKKKYWVQIRTYKNVNGVKFYSGWSAKKAIKTN